MAKLSLFRHITKNIAKNIAERQVTVRQYSFSFTEP